MLYHIVSFPDEEDKVEIINSQWLITNKKCFFPPNKEYNKYLSQPINQKIISNWHQYEIKIVKRNLGI